MFWKIWKFIVITIATALLLAFIVEMVGIPRTAYLLIMSDESLITKIFYMTIFGIFELLNILLIWLGYHMIIMERRKPWPKS